MIKLLAASLKTWESHQLKFFSKQILNKFFKNHGNRNIKKCHENFKHFLDIFYMKLRNLCEKRNLTAK